MISWIQRSFQHHMRWVFALLLIVTIISFVFIYNPASGIGGDEQAVARRQFFDIDLVSAADQSRILNDAALSVNLQIGFMGFTETQLQEFALQRVAALHLADLYRLGNPGPDQFTDFLKTLGAFAGADGQFDAAAYANFRSSLAAGGTLPESEISRIISEDWRIDRVQKLLGGPGYLLENEVRDLLDRADTRWTLNLAVADFAAFAPEISPSESELTTFFQNNLFRYEIPPQVRASYVSFTAADRMGLVEPTAEEVRSYYEINRARFPAPATSTAAEGAPSLAGAEATSPDADFAAVEATVRQAIRAERAQRLAIADASDFAFDLYDSRVTPDGLNAFLAARNLTRQPLVPFSQTAGPAEFGGSTTVAQEAFRLGPQKFYSDAITVPGGGAVLIWEETLPVRQPLFIEVRDQVLADYRENERRRLFVERGQQVRESIRQALAGGTAFADAVSSAASAAGLQITARSPEPFTLRMPPADLDSSVLGALDRMDAGQVSEMIVSGTSGLIVHTAARESPQISTDSLAFIDERNQLARDLAAYSGNSHMAEIVNAELARTEPEVVP
jgi:peptidyl-prolyl cis-trans isomerase D